MASGIDGDTFVNVVGVMVVVVGLSVAKIYVSNQIYYKSREINKLEIEVSALKEENSILSMNMEKIRYKAEVLDTIAVKDENQTAQSPNITLKVTEVFEELSEKKKGKTPSNKE